MKLPRHDQYAAEFRSEAWRAAAVEIVRRHGLACNELRRAEHGDNVVFLIDDAFALKIYEPIKNARERERAALAAARTTLALPEIVASGAIEDYRYLVTTQIKGELMTRDRWLTLPARKQISLLEELAEGLRALHQTDASAVAFDWPAFVARQAATCYERQKACGVNRPLLEAIPAFVEENFPLIETAAPPVFLHGDVHFGNLRLGRQAGRWRINGLFDFADSLKGAPEYDFLAVGVLMIQGQGALQREFFRAYGYADENIDETLQRRLMLLTMFYEWSDLRRYAIRLRPEAVDYPLDRLMREIWNFV